MFSKIQKVYAILQHAANPYGHRRPIMHFDIWGRFWTQGFEVVDLGQRKMLEIVTWIFIYSFVLT